MNEELTRKLRLLYAKLDLLEKSGEDVVADIRKEINNLELGYLKNEALPAVMGDFARRVAALRCQIDVSVRLDEEGAVDYSFCTSGSTQLFRDKIEKEKVDRVGEMEPEELSTDCDDISNVVEYAPPPPNFGKVVIVHGNSDNIDVRGDVAVLDDVFSACGGLLMRRNSACYWRFDKDAEAEVVALLQGNNFANIVHTQAPDKKGKGLNTYVHLFSNLHTATVYGHKTPHKAILLLTILKAAEESFLSDRIPLDFYFISTFNRLWAKYVPQSWNLTMNCSAPFMHMSQEPFYSLALRERIPDISISWNITAVDKYCLYASIADDLRETIKDPEARNTLRRALFARYLPQSDVRSSLERAKEAIFRKRETAIALPKTREQIEAERMSGFKNFLKTAKTESGRTLTDSTISFYLDVTKSQFIRSIVRQYEPSGSLYLVNKPKDLSNIYANVKRQFLRGVTLPAIKLYLDFFNNVYSKQHAD